MKLRTLAIAILSGIACLLMANAETFVIPKEFEKQEAPSAQNVFIPNIHRHYLLDRSFFASEIPEGGIISGLAMRVNQLNQVGSAEVFTSLGLSTSPFLPSHLSRTFSENLGPDAKTVFQGSLTITDLAPGQVAHPFDVSIPFQTPFYYDPRKGNLVVEFRVQAGADRLFLDGIFDSRVTSVLAGSGAVGGDLAGDFAPVLEFTYYPVPEPPGLALCFLAIGLLTCLKSR